MAGYAYYLPNFNVQATGKPPVIGPLPDVGNYGGYQKVDYATWLANAQSNDMNKQTLAQLQGNSEPLSKGGPSIADILKGSANGQNIDSGWTQVNGEWIAPGQTADPSNQLTAKGIPNPGTGGYTDPALNTATPNVVATASGPSGGQVTPGSQPVQAATAGATPAVVPPANQNPAPSGLQMPNTSNTQFSQFVKTKNDPTVYGIDAQGNEVPFSDPAQLAQAQGKKTADFSKVQTVDMLPSQQKQQEQNKNNEVLTSNGIEPSTLSTNNNPYKTYSDAYSQVLLDMGIPSVKAQIDTVQKQYTDLANEKNDKISDINDDPWTVQGIKDKKIQQLNDRYDGKLKVIQAQIDNYQKIYSDGLDQAKFVAQTAVTQIHDQAVLDQQKLLHDEDLIQKSLPTSALEYEYAKSQGYNGSYTQYQNEDANRKRSVTNINTGGNYQAGADPTTDAWINAVKNGNATMAQVPAAFKNSVVLGLNSGPSIVDSNTDQTVKAIIAANPGEYGHAAEAIDKAFGPGTATKYDAQLKAVYNNKQDVGTAFSSQSYSPLAGSRFATESNRITSNYIDLPAYKLTANGLPYIQRIQEAIKTPGSISDQELLDAMTKLSTSGNAVTDAQIKIITSGQNYSDQLNVFKNKLSSSGGVLSDKQRQDLVKTAKDIYSAYQTGYQPVYSQVTKQLTDAGIPKAFWTIPDLNTLSATSTNSNSNNSGGDYQSYLKAIGQ